ncbi:hypothetical protein SAMN05421819_0278 [Bryocella elongata]|uniref:Uncharacterized protein n=1 Tax=Bryocella elongata TaxID=863522 RepID=A0A1H5SPZ6_9BACT|nr:hypothetical protein [Bryocella elongata]SEF51911.1 hypothetical protein SAMN05421819_0278 [Bryocella elongata]
MAMSMMKWAATLGAVVLAGAPALHAAQLSGDARSSIPKDVQQVIVVDYRAMQNSPAAMQLKDHVLPPELKRLETALKTSGLKVDQDADTLAFAAFRTGASSNSARILGVAQGQFQTASIMAYFTKNKIKPVMVRNNQVFPMGSSGMSVSFLNQTTMVFGDKEAVKASLDARDGLAPNFLQNGDMMNEMNIVDSRAVWSLLDQKGTQTMMKSVMGSASQLADYNTVQAAFRSSRYTMEFSNGVKFDMTVVLSDSMTAATAATVMKGVMILKKTSGSPLEKSALDETHVDSTGGDLNVGYSSSDSQFASLLTSPLFQQVVK